MQNFSYLMFVALISVSQTALARSDCDQKITRPEIGGCLIENYQEADKKLNAVYSRLFALEFEGKEQLRLAQRAWISFRDAECEYMDYRGTMSNFLKLMCLEKWTLRRTEELEAHINDVQSRGW